MSKNYNHNKIQAEQRVKNPELNTFLMITISIVYAFSKFKINQ